MREPCGCHHFDGIAHDYTEEDERFICTFADCECIFDAGYKPEPEQRPA